MADRPVFVREVAHLERPLILMRDDVEKAPHFVRHEAHCLHYVCGRAAHRIDPGFRSAEIRRLDPRSPGITTLGTTGPVLRRLARLRRRQGDRLEPNAACHCVDRNDMGDDADCLDIFFFAEAGGDDIAKPALAETPGVGAHTMNNLNDGLGQFVEAVVLALDRCRRQRFLASAAQRAIRGVARLGSDREALSAIPPRAGIPDPLPSASVRGRQILADRDLRGRHCQLNLWRAKRGPGRRRDYPAATASRHWLTASARNIPSVERETRLRWRLKTLWTAACMLRKRCAEQADLNRCILRSRRRTT